ncbi:MAG: hypothetical protein J6Q77_04155 [Clostridia bacterium]|nr:hypothetical protein [Clostridia bacterium]
MSEKDNELINAPDGNPSDATDQRTVSPKKEEALTPEEEYIKRTIAFRKYYKKLLLVAGAIEATAIVLAVLWHVLAGASVAMLGAVVYFVYASDESYRRLGARYTSIPRGITLTKCRAAYGDTLIVPSSLIGLDTVSIGDRAFGTSNKNKSLRTLYLPATIRAVGKDILVGCDSLERICFEGSADEWEAIDSQTDFSAYELIFDVKYPALPKKERKEKKKKQKDSNPL